MLLLALCLVNCVQVLVFLTYAGLVKPKKYDWKDSNLALFGSDTEKQVKSEAFVFALFSLFC